MTPLEQLFALEVEFHRKLRCEATGTHDVAALHASYASQAGYQELITQLGGNVSFQTIERLRAKHGLAGDVRDLLAARDSLACLLGLWPYDGRE
jgi:hypothetical protein